MSGFRKILWFSVLYLASVAAFAVLTLSIRALLHLVQRLAET